MRTTYLLADLCLSVLAVCQYMDQQYVESVCSPDMNITAGQLIPPCISVEIIQGQCEPNGTQPLDLAAYAQCLCNEPSTFFRDWLGCRSCIEAHGGMSEGEQVEYAGLLSSVSSSLCGGLTTAKFEDVFATMEATMTRNASRNTKVGDSFPSSTAVSLYYNYTGTYPQGPGVITGTAMVAPGRMSGQESLTTPTSTAKGVSMSKAVKTEVSSVWSHDSFPPSLNDAAPIGNTAVMGLMAAAGGIVFAL
ncbi:hypothetical protein FKW77_007168 [Venturia effusa]|uniref:Extracellular membrane protein CFEM domain-containing protein n=1 Tax=Venturia effusa TaxID=50376 RepID=A0A517LE34_9PEZI|nr:hypothetical protein FKW77_007168 [Venturia effusa]